ncbi:hypothetical protein CALVIDRAFT_541880 [Calocera viscosa TUFC12733]|uniref:Uncharacterized protein n=1 Tax=Calocera viscosa (strain TUFC12733) TaxID=1330018 RepID=A0A167H8K7_CALVF|nr:hypothetical protein CALVIDRAFT_541880 [Calocera viscosa TUFC12733]
MPDIKPFAVKEEEQKRSFASNGFAGAPRRTFALDTQVLYATSGRLWTERRPLHRVAVDMGLHEADDGICAANELIDIWNVASRILSGPPIFFVKGYIEEDVRAKKAEEEYYKLEEQGRGQDGGAVPPGGVFGAPPPIPTAAQYASKPKGDFYDDALADDDDW